MISNISIIVAIARDGAIGRDNKLLWHLSSDLKHFKSITSGHTIIMGRKTFESIGRALPNRRNIVISRQTDLIIEGVDVFNSLDNALKAVNSEQEVFVIGGGNIYEQTMDIASKLYLTVVDHVFEADTFFPPINKDNWELVSSESNEEKGLNFRFENYIKK